MGCTAIPTEVPAARTAELQTSAFAVDDLVRLSAMILASESGDMPDKNPAFQEGRHQMESSD